MPSIKVMKDQGSLRNCPRLEETMKIQRQNAVWDPGLDSGIEKEDISGGKWGNVNKTCSLANSISWF